MRIALVLTTMLAITSSAFAQPVEATCVYLNANIYTMDPDNPRAEAIAKLAKGNPTLGLVHSGLEISIPHLSATPSDWRQRTLFEGQCTPVVDPYQAYLCERSSQAFTQASTDGPSITAPV